MMWSQQRRVSSIDRKIDANQPTGKTTRGRYTNHILEWLRQKGAHAFVTTPLDPGEQQSVKELIDHGFDWVRLSRFSTTRFEIQVPILLAKYCWTRLLIPRSGKSTVVRNICSPIVRWLKLFRMLRASSSKIDPC